MIWFSCIPRCPTSRLLPSDLSLSRGLAKERVDASIGKEDSASTLTADRIRRSVPGRYKFDTLLGRGMTVYGEGLATAHSGQRIGDLASPV